MDDKDKKTDKQKDKSYRSRHSPEDFQDPVLGYLQAMVLSRLIALGDEGFGYKVNETMREEGILIDNSQVYAAMAKLARRRLIERTGSRKSDNGGPPQKMWRVTQAGREVLLAVIRHHEAVVAYLKKQQ